MLPVSTRNPAPCASPDDGVSPRVHRFGPEVVAGYEAVALERGEVACGEFSHPRSVCPAFHLAGFVTAFRPSRRDSPKSSRAATAALKGARAVADAQRDLEATRGDLMHVRRMLIAATTAAIFLGMAPPSHGAAKTYKNCTALNKDYPHGVGRKGARDKTSGTPVTNFKVSNSLYAANRHSDRDGDGVACEKR
jgi:hypothetical protein